MAAKIIKAKVAREFSGKPDDEIKARTIAKGEVIKGELARVAIDNKWATEIKGGK